MYMIQDTMVELLSLDDNSHHKRLCCCAAHKTRDVNSMKETKGRCFKWGV